MKAGDSFREQLRDIADETDFRRRQRMERALSNHPPRHAMRALTEALGSPEVRLRRTAIEVLRRMAVAGRREAVVDRLVAHLTTETDVKTVRRTAAALGSIGSPRAIPPLTAALATRTHRFEQASLILALGRLGFEDWPAALRERQNEDGPVGDALRRALRQVDDRPNTAEAIPPPGGRFLAECYVGVEGILERELGSLGVEVGPVAPGWVAFESPEAGALPVVRSAKALFSVQADLGASANLDGITEAVVPLAERTGSQTFRLSLPRQEGWNTYRRQVLDLCKAIERRTPLVNAPSGYDLDLRVVETEATGLRLVWRDMRWPTPHVKRKALPASVHPSVAGALCWAAWHRSPGVGQFLDPCMGSGTILATWLGSDPSRHATGVDRDRHAVDLAVENLVDTADRVTLQVGDMTRLPFADRTFRWVIANLPFGIRTRSEPLARAYRGFVAEALRVVLPDGVVLAYTARRDLLVAALRHHDATPEAVTTIQADATSVAVVAFSARR